MAAFVIGHPDQAKDGAAVNLAAVQAMVAAYRAILKENPKATWKAMDAFARMADTGELENFVREQSDKCHAATNTVGLKADK